MVCRDLCAPEKPPHCGAQKHAAAAANCAGRATPPEHARKTASVNHPASYLMMAELLDCSATMHQSHALEVLCMLNPKGHITDWQMRASQAMQGCAHGLVCRASCQNVLVEGVEAQAIDLCCMRLCGSSQACTVQCQDPTSEMQVLQRQV